MSPKGRLKVVSIIDSLSKYNPIKILQNSKNSALYTFTEKVHYCLSSHRFLNWITSVLFFILFILNSIARIFLTGRPLGSQFHPRDIIFILCGLRPEFAVPEDIEMAILISCITNLFYIVFAIFVFWINKKYCSIFTNSFVICWFEIAPLILYMDINACMQGYSLIGSVTRTGEIYSINPLITFSIICHLVIIIIFGCSFIYFSETPRDIVHPFIPMSSNHSIYLVLYFFIIGHISGFYYEYSTALFMIRIILSLAMLISHIYSPYYSNRFMNSLFMLAILVETVSTTVYSGFNEKDGIYLLSDYDPLKPYAYMDLRFTIIITSIPISFAISMLYFYFIFPLIGWKDQFHVIKNAYISGDLKRAILLLKTLKLVNVETFNIHEILKTSINLKFNGSGRLAFDLVTNSKFLQSSFTNYYLWASMNIIDIEIRRFIPEHAVSSAIKYEQKINELEKQFWTEVYLSNLSNLPQISSKISLNLCLEFLSMENEVRQCPKLLQTKCVPPRIAHQVKKAYKLGEFKKFVYNLSLFDLAFFIGFVFTLVGHVFLVIGSKPKWFLINDSSHFLNFTKQFMIFEISLYKWNFDSSNINKLNLTDIRMHYHDFSKNYESLINITHKPTSDLLQTEYNNVALIDQMNLFLNSICTIPEFYHFSSGGFCPTIPSDKNLLVSDQFNSSDNEVNHLNSDRLNIKAVNENKRKIFVDTINHINYTIRSMHESFRHSVKPHIEIRFLFVYLFIIIFFALFIFFVAIYSLILMRKNHDFYLGFSMIRKSNLKDYKTESMKGMYQFRRKQTFSFLKSYPWTSSAILWCFICIILHFGLFIADFFGDEQNSNLIFNTIEKISHFQTIPLFFISGFVIPNQTLISLSSKIVDEVYENQYFFPPGIYDVYGDFLYSGYANRQQSTNINMSQEWIKQFEEIEQNLDAGIQFYSYVYNYSVRRFIAYFGCALSLFIIMMIVQNKINFFMKREQEIWSRILYQFAHKHNQAVGYEISNDNNSDTSDSLEDINDTPVNHTNTNNELPIEVDHQAQNTRIRINVIDGDDEYECELNPNGPKKSKKIIQSNRNSHTIWPGLIKTFDQKKIPLFFFGVDKNMKVIFSTDPNRSKVGKRLSSNELIDFLQENMKEMNKNCKQDMETVWELPNKNGLTIPFLMFLNKENKFEVNYMVVVLVEDSATKVDQFQNRFESIFKSIYPSFLYHHEIPATISTKQNYRMILVIKLYGFDNIFMKHHMRQPLSKSPRKSIVNLDLARITIRRMISKALSQELEEQTYIHRIRETNSEIIITFDQENDKIAWNLIEYGTNISKFVFENLKKLKKNLDQKMVSLNNESHLLNLSATALLYKAKVNEMIVTKERESYMDFVGNILFEAEQLLPFCVPFHLNYISTFNEKAKMKYTTKFKTVTIERDSNLQKYDLFIGV